MGDLGFRDLRRFNLAFLRRQVWRFVRHKETHCFWVLNDKYFSDDNVFCAKMEDKPSYTWNSIVAAIRVFDKGSDWHIGNGMRP